MKIKKLLFLSISLIFLAGCFSAFDLSSSDVESIEIYENEVGDQTSVEPFKTFEDSSEIKLFVDTINSSKKYDGAVDMGMADFNAKVVLQGEGDREFSLWVNENSIKGAVKEVGVEGVYGLSKSETDELKGLLLE